MYTGLLLRSAKCKRLWFSLILGSLCLARTNLLFAQGSYCPASISVKQTAEKIPDGWTATQDDMPNPWEGVTFYSGPPKENASLVYDRWTKSNGVESGIWHFARNASPPIWLSCRYSFTNVALAKQLPSNTTECMVVYKARTSPAEPLEIQKVACR
jgi:hypothetical protein